MPVSSGKHEIKELNRYMQFFDIADIFRYVKKTTGQEILYEVVESYQDDIVEDCSKCDFRKYCDCEYGSISPSCAAMTRKDGKSVYFKELS